MELPRPAKTWLRIIYILAWVHQIITGKCNLKIKFYSDLNTTDSLSKYWSKILKFLDCLKKSQIRAFKHLLLWNTYFVFDASLFLDECNEVHLL